MVCFNCQKEVDEDLELEPGVFGWCSGCNDQEQEHYNKIEWNNYLDVNKHDEEIDNPNEEDFYDDEYMTAFDYDD